MAEPGASTRRARAAAWALVGLSLLGGCASPSLAGPGTPAGPGAPAADPGVAAGEVLGRFTAALRAGRFAEAWPLLSTRWRERTTPEQLAADWRGAGPIPAEAADRVAALLASGARPVPSPERSGQPRSCALAVGPGRSARLVEQAGGWRVDALE